MNMILTLKNIEKGAYTVQIKNPFGSMQYKNVEPEKLYDFIQAHDFYCETNNFKFIFLIDAKIKSFVAERLKNLEELYNNRNV